jgi:hypothetical protein
MTVVLGVSLGECRAVPERTPPLLVPCPMMLLPMTTGCREIYVSPPGKRQSSGTGDYQGPPPKRHRRPHSLNYDHDVEITSNSVPNQPPFEPPAPYSSRSSHGHSRLEHLYGWSAQICHDIDSLSSARWMNDSALHKLMSSLIRDGAGSVAVIDPLAAGAWQNSPRARRSWISVSLLSVLSMTPYESVISRLSTSLSLVGCLRAC